MRKLIILFLALTVSFGSSNVFAQGAPKPIFGAKGGLNLANIGGDEADNKMKTAFHAGVYYEHFFDYFLMMQMELLFSLQGHGKDPNQSFANSLNLWYLTLPIMARYNLGYNFNVHTGIQFAFLMSANSKYTDSSTNEEIKTDVKEQLKGIDFSIPVGVGYEFLDRKYSATLRYMIPLSDINNKDVNPNALKRTNSVFQISLGIRLFPRDF